MRAVPRRGARTGRDGDGGVQLSEFNYTYRADSGSGVTAGLIDPSAWLDRSRITNDENTHFLNGNFVNNATIDFPDYTLGGVFRTPQSASRPEVTLLIASSAGIADLPDRSYQDLLNLTADERGAFLGPGAGWQQETVTVRLTPSVQYAENPGFTLAGPVDSSSALILSVRLHWSF